MEEISKTFQDLGMTPKLYKGAADVYRFATKNFALMPLDPFPTYHNERFVTQSVQVLLVVYHPDP